MDYSIYVYAEKEVVSVWELLNKNGIISIASVFLASFFSFMISIYMFKLAEKKEKQLRKEEEVRKNNLLLVLLMDNCKDLIFAIKDQGPIIEEFLKRNKKSQIPEFYVLENSPNFEYIQLMIEKKDLLEIKLNIEGGLIKNVDLCYKNFIAFLKIRSDLFDIYKEYKEKIGDDFRQLWNNNVGEISNEIDRLISDSKTELELKQLLKTKRDHYENMKFEDNIDQHVMKYIHYLLLPIKKDILDVNRDHPNLIKLRKLIKDNQNLYRMFDDYIEEFQMAIKYIMESLSKISEQLTQSVFKLNS